MNALCIEPAGPRDADSLAAFARRTFIDAYGGDAPPPHVIDYAASAFDAAAVRRQLADPGCLFLVARHDDRYAAYVKLCRRRPIEELEARAPMQIERIYVDRRKQRAGLGTRILHAALTAARHEGVDAIWLSVWDKNAPAQRFYRRNGFEIVGKTHFMLGPERQEDYIMARRLD